MARPAPRPEAPFASPSQLTATLVDPSTIGLAWKHEAAEPAGYWIEFATPGADFVKLEVAWSPGTSFTHRDVAPETTFLYRVVPFFGRVSNEVAATTGTALQKGPSPAEGPMEEPGSAAPDRAGSSIKAMATIAAAAPANLTMARVSSTTAELRWEDRAADEDGYLLELAQDPGGFQVCALLPPNTTSFRKIALPPGRAVRFRVRAFFYGQPSSLVTIDTPKEAPPIR
jgi:hypothetical protein